MQSSVGGLVQRVAVQPGRCIHCGVAMLQPSSLRRDTVAYARKTGNVQKVPPVEKLEWQAPLKVVKYPNPQLRAPNARIANFDERLKELARQMFQIMYQDDGVGLAAPQVGVNVRLMVFNETAQPGAPEETVLVNPSIIEKGKATDIDVEGCLSFPGIYADVERATKIEVQYQDLEGRLQQMALRDFPARIFQHEYDHLQGVLFHDRMKSTELEKIRQKLLELEESFVAANPGASIQRVPAVSGKVAAKAKGFGSVSRR